MTALATPRTPPLPAAYAEVYDHFTALHRHGAWLGTIETIARRHGLAGKRVLDLACGTGNSFLPLCDRGFRVTACDISPAMVTRAAGKAAGRAEVLVADMCDLEDLGEFDLVTCLDDSLNYLQGTDDLAAAFAAARRQLGADGLYVFDVNTLGTYRTIFASCDAWEADGCLCIWRGQSRSDLPPGGSTAVVAEVFVPSEGYWKRVSATHHQRHFTHEEIERALARAGLRLLGTYGHRTDGSWSEGFDELLDNKRIYACAQA